MTSSSSRLDWRRPALALASTVVGLTVCEVVLRVGGVEPNAGRELQVKCEGRQRHGDWRCRHMFFQQDQFREDAELMWAPRPGAVPFNRLGYRGPEVDERKTPGTARVLAVGDSNTLGPPGLAWPHVLEEELARELDRPVEVLNGGVYGYTSYQGLRRLEQMLTYQPDVVLVSFGSNDALWTEDLPDAEFAELSRSIHHGGARRFHLRTFEILTHWVRQRSRSDGLVPRVSPTEYRANLERMVETAAAHGARTVLLTRPLIPQYCPMPMDETDWQQRLPRYNATVMAVAAAERVAAVDVEQHFAERRELFTDESHFTDGGSREMAVLLLDPVLEALGEKPAAHREADPAFVLESAVEIPGSGARAPAVAMDRSGRIFVAWIETGARTGVACTRLTVAGELDPVSRLVETEEPISGVALAAQAEGGAVAVAWVDERGLVWTLDSGTGFGAPAPAFADRWPVTPPALVYEGERLWLAWVEAGAAGTGEAWLATLGPDGWEAPVHVGSGIHAAAPLALIADQEPGRIWMAQRGVEDHPDEVVVRTFAWTDAGLERGDPMTIGEDLPSSLQGAGPAPRLTNGTSTDPLVVFANRGTDSQRALHSTSTCGPTVARTLGADRGGQGQPTVAYVGSGLAVAAWPELSGPAPRIRIAYSENGGTWFSPGRPIGGESGAGQLAPALASNGAGDAFALAYVLGDRCVVQRGRVINPRRE